MPRRIVTHALLHGEREIVTLQAMQRGGFRGERARANERMHLRIGEAVRQRARCVDAMLTLRGGECDQGERRGVWVFRRELARSLGELRGRGFRVKVQSLERVTLLPPGASLAGRTERRETPAKCERETADA